MRAVNKKNYYNTLNNIIQRMSDSEIKNEMKAKLKLAASLNNRSNKSNLIRAMEHM